MMDLFWIAAALVAIVALGGMAFAAAKFAAMNKKYRVLEIMRDLKAGKITEAELNEATRVSSIVEDLKHGRAKLSDLMWLTEARIRSAVSISNTYGRGPKIELDKYLMIMRTGVAMLPQNVQSALNSATAVGKLIRDAACGRLAN
jgi:hypothetical protein